MVPSTAGGPSLKANVLHSTSAFLLVMFSEGEDGIKRLAGSVTECSLALSQVLTGSLNSDFSQNQAEEGENRGQDFIVPQKQLLGPGLGEALQDSQSSEWARLLRQETQCEASFVSHRRQIN